ncbi:Regulator of nucleoside diphosphate kinase [Pseudomonas syringae pv. atrofaciens]|uniref:Regulator of nucleoside diphosphate kinase n=1 Tax=Pseudomonas syringae pv. lapsa TaxID=199201 RepID=A0AB73ZZR9_PSESX|nr:Regulator of nucleoside diphosphate kinase [Pseudomonas syringae pv. lapsa]RML22379.1 Regulator of nucleoside diphosphate kinase [Pseudomonas syringae pv. lapsa]RMM26239.1 Regulator of nucleoside diphosphate kinase [Pseudomonas syringae pv. pisi]RMM50933.1 Regulator of nucleoside diphosphate kinase [Pseudomonas syringae pv. atrofaciens]RMR47739.1 Regulator of nucleoside diphosphate kinase [Pseudomonas syringae pv. syringae]
MFYSWRIKESAQTMTTAPSIILTRLDVQRLEKFIADQNEDTPGIQALQAELDRADQVVGHDEVPAGVVTMNSRVHCREEVSGKDYHLKLVYPQDAGADGTVSVLAPMGSALLGLQIGQHIDWPAPGGKTLKLTLLAVEYQPEAAGEYE